MSESEQDDRMGARLDETLKAIEALQRDLNDRQRYFEMNPHVVFTHVLSPLCAILGQIHGTIVLLDGRLDQVERGIGSGAD